MVKKLRFLSDVYLAFSMASDMETTPQKDQQKKKNALPAGRSIRPRSAQFVRSDPWSGVRNNRNAPRERRRPVFNGRNSTPKHKNGGGRGLHTRNNPRSMIMDVGPPPSTFRPPLPMNNSCHYPSNFSSSRSMTYSNQSLSDRLHENTNRAFNSLTFQRSIPPGAIPANHVQFPSSLMRRQNRYVSRLNVENWCSNQYAHHRMPPNQSWGFPPFPYVSPLLANRNRTTASNPPSNRWARPRGSGRSRRGRQTVRNYLRNNRPRPVSRAKRHLRWRNNYRDLQRAIRCYFRLTSRDPLGLDDICRENRRRDNLGLTPLRGDSAMNTPAYSLNTPVPHRDIEIPPQPASLSHQPREQSQDTEPDATATPQTNGQREEADSIERSSSEDSRARSQADRERTPDDAEASASPAQNHVIRDRFHQRHRSVVTLNSRGNSRFAERPVTGNYHNYYTRRPTSVTESTFRQYVEAKRCLDIGCNSGAVTLRLAEMNPVSLVGIDSDGRLIQEARRELEKARRAERNRRRGDLNSREEGCAYYLNNVSFRTADYVPDVERNFEPQYDTIIALSVTKWVHLVYGDSGLQRFFRRIYEELREGGHFLVEPQPLPSYRKSYQPDVHFDPETQLNLKPPFDTELIDLGFTSEGCAIDGRPTSADFRSRCVYIYAKKAPEAISTNQLTAGYPRPPPCYYYPSPVYRGLVSSQPSSSLNFPMTPSHASPTGSYLNEDPGPSHVLTAGQDNYSPYSSESEDFLPPGPSHSAEHSPVPLNYVLPVDEESSAEETNSGAISEASTSVSQAASGIGRSSLKMRLRRLDHPNGSFSWTIDGSAGYDTDEEPDDLILEADDEEDEIFDASSDSRLTLDPWDLSDRHSSEDEALL